MSTDKTLADVQPGGRVRLGDAIPSPLFDLREAAQHVLHCADCGGDYNCGRPMIDALTTLGIMKKTGRGLWSVNARAAQAVVDALSAQPSPGGQGDALKALDDLAAFCSDDTATVDRHVAVIRAALAASQPVGNYEVQTENGPLKCSLAVYAEWQKNEEYIERLKAELAARQPVGQFKVVAYQQITPSADDPEVLDAKLWALPPGHPVPAGCTPLYWWNGSAAQPAQAVDLNGARDSIQALLNWIDDWAETPEESGLDPIADRALEVVAQIDAQVYAHEPNNNPAQAVDLGQFREPIAAWSKHCAHSFKGYESYQDSDLPDWMAERRQQVRKCGELLALIDSHTAGGQP